MGAPLNQLWPQPLPISVRCTWNSFLHKVPLHLEQLPACSQGAPGFRTGWGGAVQEASGWGPLAGKIKSPE